MTDENRYNYLPLPEPIPVTEQVWTEGTVPLVHIRTMTYMHEKYIRDCIEGFLIQKTTFPVCFLIHDDASTDRTPEIIREYEKCYPKLIKAFYQTDNSYIHPNRLQMRAEFFSWRTGKYEALCEGDDYWTDPLKLQKQVEFMEKNPEYGMVYTRVMRYNQTAEKFEKRPWGGPYTEFVDLIKGNVVPTLSVLSRLDLIKQYQTEIQPQQHQWSLGDYPVWLWFAFNSKIHFMSDVTAVYRILDNSMSNFKDYNKKEKFQHSYISIQDFYSRKYLNKALDINKILNKSMEGFANRQKDRKKALEYLKKCGDRNLKFYLKRIFYSNSFLYFIFLKMK